MVGHDKWTCSMSYSLGLAVYTTLISRCLCRSISYSLKMLLVLMNSDIHKIPGVHVTGLVTFFRSQMTFKYVLVTNLILKNGKKDL